MSDDRSVIGLLCAEGGALRVRQAVSAGYVKAFPGDIMDLSYPNSKNRRARVQEGVSPALTCGCGSALYFFEGVVYDD